jgi:hypothetical protein
VSPPGLLAGSVSLLLALLLPLRPVAINPGGFPNSITTSPRGWRSWNAVMEDVTQEFITRQVDALTVRRLSVDGKPTSLLDLGFNRVGIDAGWNLCTGVNGSWHDESGHFIIDKTRFPDMKAMTDHAHSLGVKMDLCVPPSLPSLPAGQPDAAPMRGLSEPLYLCACKNYPQSHLTNWIATLDASCLSYLNQDGLCPEGRIPGASAKTGNPHYVQDAMDTAALGFVSTHSVVTPPVLVFTTRH